MSEENKEVINEEIEGVFDTQEIFNTEDMDGIREELSNKVNKVRPRKTVTLSIVIGIIITALVFSFIVVRIRQTKDLDDYAKDNNMTREEVINLFGENIISLLYGNENLEWLDKYPLTDKCKSQISELLRSLKSTENREINLSLMFDEQVNEELKEKMSKNLVEVEVDGKVYLELDKDAEPVEYDLTSSSIVYTKDDGNSYVKVADLDFSMGDKDKHAKIFYKGENRVIKLSTVPRTYTMIKNSGEVLNRATTEKNSNTSYTILFESSNTDEIKNVTIRIDIKSSIDAFSITGYK